MSITKNDIYTSILRYLIWIVNPVKTDFEIALLEKQHEQQLQCFI